MDEVILAVLDSGKQYEITILPEDNSINVLIDYARFSHKCGSDFNKCLGVVVDYHRATLLEPKKLDLRINEEHGQLEPDKKNILEGIITLQNDYVLQTDSLKVARGK